MTGSTAGPAAVRQLETPAARALADLAAIIEDLQTVLACCERVVSELTGAERAPDDLVVEALWTTALLSYGRCFASRDSGMGLTEDDVSSLPLQGELVQWHRALLQLREHYADPARNPREIFTAGAAQDAGGAATGVAITSARQPLVDELAVRQTGAIAYQLGALVDKRITRHQEIVLQAVQTMPQAELERLPLVDVADA